MTCRGPLLTAGLSGGLLPLARRHLFRVGQRAARPLPERRSAKFRRALRFLLAQGRQRAQTYCASFGAASVGLSRVLALIAIGLGFLFLRERVVRRLSRSVRIRLPASVRTHEADNRWLEWAQAALRVNRASFLLQLRCAPPTPSADDALKRNDIELVGNPSVPTKELFAKRILQSAKRGERNVEKQCPQSFAVRRETGNE